MTATTMTAAGGDEAEGEANVVAGWVESDGGPHQDRVYRIVRRGGGGNFRLEMRADGGWESRGTVPGPVVEELGFRSDLAAMYREDLLGALGKGTTRTAIREPLALEANTAVSNTTKGGSFPKRWHAPIRPLPRMEPAAAAAPVQPSPPAAPRKKPGAGSRFSPAQRANLAARARESWARRRERFGPTGRSPK